MDQGPLPGRTKEVRPTRRLRIVGIALALAAIVPGWSGVPGAAASQGGACQPWHQVQINAGDQLTELEGVDGVSGDDLWAVTNTSPQPTITHWNGARWQSGPVESARGVLDAVDVLTTSDAWAVGSVIMHWDGQIWHNVHQLAPPNFLFGVSGSGPSDVWAVGIAGAERGLIDHWDGVSWSKVPFETMKDGIAFQDVVAIAPDDAWAVGYSLREPTRYLPFIQHWDGADWLLVPIPGQNQNIALVGIDASGPDDVWAIGGSNHPVIYHWDGVTWAMMSQAHFAGTVRLQGISVVGPDDVWVAGLIGAGGPPVTAHWNGSQWTMISVANKHNAWINAIKAFGPDDVWAVGHDAGEGAITARFVSCPDA